MHGKTTARFWPKSEVARRLTGPLLSVANVQEALFTTGHRTGHLESPAIGSGHAGSTVHGIQSRSYF